MALIQKERAPVSDNASSAQQPMTTDFPPVSLILWALTLVGMAVTIWMALLSAPTDAVQGPPQRIFYFHVPVAWIGMLAFVVMAAAGVAYLWKKDERWDWLARASAEIGLVFISLALITGSIWGRVTWGTWWTWDARLTTTLILWFIYVGYLMLRGYMGRTPASARSGAVMAIICVIDVPIIYESVNWWRTLHPTAEVGVQGALPPSVVLTLMVSLTTFTILYTVLMISVYQLQRVQTRAQRLRASVEE